VAILCPKCGATTRVVRSDPGKHVIVRRRECEGCGERFTTKEQKVSVSTPPEGLSGISSGESEPEG
jgi:transcriptional regulator NrdR family protein